MRIVKERAPVQLLASSTRRSTACVRICSWCKRVEVENQQWVTAEDAMISLRLYEQERLPRLKHSICNACLPMLKKIVRMNLLEAYVGWNRNKRVGVGETCLMLNFRKAQNAKAI